MRVGLELELLAGVSHSRITLTHALARAFGGTVRFGLKYASPGRDARGAPICLLSLAGEVQIGSRTLLTLVDDLTICDDLNRQAPGLFPCLLTDDIRLATWLERNTHVDGFEPSKLVAAMAKTFAGTLVDDTLVDPSGAVLAHVQRQGGERERVTEIVTAPLVDEERVAVLRTLLEVSRDLQFCIPSEAALHVHFDASPFASTQVLRRLILGYSTDREQWHEVLRPNPRCRKLGPFPEAVRRVAAEAPADMSFPIFAAAIDLALPGKGFDINLLGIVQRYPRQPTLEVRCLPMTLDSDLLLQSVAHVENRLAQFLSIA